MTNEVIWKTYIKNVLVGIDQLCNAIIGGDPDETISARCWRHRDNKAGYLAYKFIDSIFNVLGYPNHCASSAEPDFNTKNEIWGG